MMSLCLKGAVVNGWSDEKNTELHFSRQINSEYELLMALSDAWEISAVKYVTLEFWKNPTAHSVVDLKEGKIPC